jgi:uncharacterized protein
MQKPAALADKAAWLRMGPGCVTIQVRVRPGSSRAGVLRVSAEALVIGVNSPPEKGRANNELVALVAEIAGVTRSAVAIVRGAASRDKLLRIETADAPAIIARILGRARTP